MLVQRREWVEINSGKVHDACDEGEDDKQFYYCPTCENHCFLDDLDEGFKIDLLSPDGFSMYNGKLYDDTEEAIEDFLEWKQRYVEQGYYSSNKGRIDILDLYDHMIFKVIKFQKNGMDKH